MAALAVAFFAFDLGHYFTLDYFKSQQALINDYYARSGTQAVALGRVILAAYYRDDRVLLALGLEARSPFPKGHTVEQGDWSLLDPVRRRAPFWRDDRTSTAKR